MSEVGSSSVHELHNHVAVIQGFAHLCLEAVDAGRTPDREHLAGIVRAADAASRALRAVTERSG